ncbi:cytochrome P450 [Paenibacillus sp. MWE-103]|uniref:Cytochrome P450 n=1 Tax=Paenibacillus artemisiicola TaxID=1172618 RepID=A0ABS3WBH9_9BACL|nr:cytochrome P450 [Paenibacillus artemisiicola]MBO7745672.1 cytochrome P450 [Paenibacillus artemisiicola]
MQELPAAFATSDIEAWFRTYSPRLHGSPNEFYAYLLESEPLSGVADAGYWVASRYEDVNRILKDPVFVRESRNALPEPQRQELPPPSEEWKPVGELLDNWMLFRDPPAHTRLRRLVSHAFLPRAMDRLEPKVRGIAEYLADEMAEASRPDLIASFAFPLPVIVIAELLGVPPEDRELFKAWSHVFAGVLEGGDRPAGFALQAKQAAEEISAYFRDLIAERKTAPREDMISELIAAHEQGERLTEQELVATCVLMLVAGHETTVNLIGNSVYCLLRHPDQLALLLARPELAASAVEEALRFESPVRMTSRIASADYEIGGRTIRQGQSANVILGAANRDPAQFERPNVFDIERSPNRHLAFASGPHFCLGAPLARMEGELALSALLSRYPRMRLADGEPNWRQSLLFRGLETMPLYL